MSAQKEETIPAWLDGKSVFITGGTGFIGKVLVEKLLRSCPNMDNVYLLMRSKRGRGLEERLLEYLQSPIFNVLRDKNKQAFKKIVCVNGDASELYLGLSDADVQTIKDNVSIVFHAAASVKFDQPLRDAILLNTRGTLQVINLSRSMAKLEVLVHVSTAYANNEYQHIREEIYPPRVNWQKIIKLAERSDHHQLEVYCRKVLGLQPNTYTFTKSLAENLVDDYKCVLPVVVYRPTVVTSTRKEPIAGFIDNLSSPIAIGYAAGRGVLRVCTDIHEMDYAPVDWVVNGMIAVAWHRVKHRNVKLVYTTQSMTMSPQRLRDDGFKHNEVRPILQIWHPFLFFISNSSLYWTLFILLHVFPAIVIDGIAGLIGKPKIFLNIYRKAYVALGALDQVTCRNYYMATSNYEELESYLTEPDRTSFYIRENINEEFKTQYIIIGAEGARAYLFNEPFQSKYVTIHRIQKYLHYSLVAVIGWYIAYELISKISTHFEDML